MDQMGVAARNVKREGRRVLYTALALLAAGACGGVGPPAEQAATAASPSAATPALRAQNTQPAFETVELVLRAGHLDASGLELEVAFENTSQSAYGLAGTLQGEDFRLVAAGTRLPPTALSPELEPLEPPAGFAPGSRKVGRLRFDAPPGPPPYSLELPSFTPLTFDPAALPPLTPQLQSLSADSPTVSAASVPAEVETLLDQQAQALVRYDARTYLAAFTAAAQPAERQIFQQLRSVPLAEVTLVPQPGATPRRSADGRRLGLDVGLRYKLAGIPADNPFLHTLRYGLEEGKDGWRIAGIEDDPARPVFFRQPDLEIGRTHHFLIASHTSLAADLGEVEQDAEAAYAILAGRGLALAEGYLVQVVPDERAFRRLVGRGGVLGAAIATYAILPSGVVEVHSQAFYLNGAVFSPRDRTWYYSPEARRLTVTHEMVHLALAATSRPFTPPWLKEGAAVYFSDGLTFDDGQELARSPDLGRLSVERLTRAGVLGAHEIFGGEGETAREYIFSAAVVAYLVETYGQERFFAFYRSFCDAPPAASLTTPLRKRSLHTIFRSVTSPLAVELTARGLDRYYELTTSTLDAAAKKWLVTRYP